MWIIISVFFVITFFIAFSAFFNIRRRVRQNAQNKKLLETVTKLHRGTKTERNLVLKLLKNGIPAQTIFHDLYVKNSNGEFSQIDLVVATKVGIIVFEVKDYSGWLFGKGNQTQWTKVLAYGRDKYRFYNPVMQNSGHIIALRKKSKQFEQVPFYSIIVFYGNCELKDVSLIPEGTFLTYSTNVIKVVNGIINNNEPAKFTDKWEVIRILKESVENGNSIAIRNQHIKNIQTMLNENRLNE